MIRGTTPTHIFNLPFAASTISKLRLTYAQNGDTVLEKTETDCTFDGNTVSVKLSQEESLLFEEQYKVELQLKALTTDGETMATAIKAISVGRILNEEVL